MEQLAETVIKLAHKIKLKTRNGATHFYNVELVPWSCPGEGRELLVKDRQTGIRTGFKKAYETNYFHVD